jgi:hypothetical protein
MRFTGRREKGRDEGAVDLAVLLEPYAVVTPVAPAGTEGADAPCTPSSV